MEKQKKQQIIVYAVAVMIGCAFCWWLFTPDSPKKESHESELLAELPNGTSRPLITSKKDAYMEAEYNTRKTNKMRSFEEIYNLADSSTSTPKNHQQEKPNVLQDVQKANNQIQNIYTQMSNDEEYDNLMAEKRKLEKQVAELELAQRQAALERNQQQATQLVSYAQTKLAGKENESEPIKEVQEKREGVQVTSKVNSNTVSSLNQAAEVIEEHQQQYGFNTPIGSGYEMGANTIKACIHESQTCRDGERVKLRLLEPLRAGRITLPAGHIISGVAALQKDRLDIIINSVEYSGNIIPVAMTVYDMDGNAGIYCPGSEELNATKEVGANIGTSLGSSISFAKSAGQQIAMDVTRGIMQGGSQYLSKKLRTVKVTLKENYKVLLLPKIQ